MWRIDAWAALLVRIESTDDQGQIANNFRIDTETRPVRYQDVEWILLNQSRRLDAHLLVGCAHDDQFVHLLLRPAPFHEFGGEPIQQLGMRGHFALESEIFHGPNQTATEEGFPLTVHHDASGQGILRRNQPFGEAEPVGR